MCTSKQLLSSSQISFKMYNFLHFFCFCFLLAYNALTDLKDLSN